MQPVLFNSTFVEGKRRCEIRCKLFLIVGSVGGACQYLVFTHSFIKCGRFLMVEILSMCEISRSK